MSFERSRISSLTNSTSERPPFYRHNSLASLSVAHDQSQPAEEQKWPTGWKPYTCLAGGFLLMFNSWGLVWLHLLFVACQIAADNIIIGEHLWDVRELLQTASLTGQRCYAVEFGWINTIFRGLNTVRRCWSLPRCWTYPRASYCWNSFGLAWIIPIEHRQRAGLLQPRPLQLDMADARFGQRSRYGMLFR